MDSYSFDQGGWNVVITKAGLASATGPAGTALDLSGALMREILRLAESEQGLRETLQAERATPLKQWLATMLAERDAAKLAAARANATLDRLLGNSHTVESATAALAEAAGLKLAIEEGREIIGELSAALAVLAGESLERCGGAWERKDLGHLGPKAMKAVRQALAEWRALQKQNQAARAELAEKAGEIRELKNQLEVMTRERDALRRFNYEEMRFAADPRVVKLLALLDSDEPPDALYKAAAETWQRPIAAVWRWLREQVGKHQHVNPNSSPGE